MRVHLVDGTYELFRAHFSKTPPRTSPSGRDVKATTGVVSSLLRLLEDPDEQVSHIAVAFDNPIESFRNERFAGYKDSTGVDRALLDQFDDVERAVEAIGVTVWSVAEHEADDALATAARSLSPQVEQVRILTPDKDLGQAVVGRSVVQVDRRQQKEFDADGVRERLGVAPASVPDLLALVGDTADGIPGLRGFGAKTAAALLTRYPHLEDIPLDAGQWQVAVRGAPRLAETLRTHLDDAMLYRELATLVTDVPLDCSLEHLRWDGVPRTEYLAWCEVMGATTLRDRPQRWAS